MVKVVLAILGLCFGSFVNALVWRLRKQEQMVNKATKSKKQKAKYSILTGRSMCTNCGHTLVWYDLLPILSWLSLRGKCRYCHKAISWQYPFVELVTALLFVFSYLFWPSSAISSQYSLLFAFWLVFLTGFTALAVYDLHWMILPDRIVIPLQGLAVLYVLAAYVASGYDWHVIVGSTMGVIFSAGLFYLLFQISKGKWIGGGDVKLAVVLGLILGGAAESLLMIFIASLLGSLIGIPLLITKKTKLQGKLPFGPLLITATVVVFLFGASMIAWYKQHVLIV